LENPSLGGRKRVSRNQKGNRERARLAAAPAHEGWGHLDEKPKPLRTAYLNSERVARERKDGKPGWGIKAKGKRGQVRSPRLVEEAQ